MLLAISLYSCLEEIWEESIFASKRERYNEKLNFGYAINSCASEGNVSCTRSTAAERREVRGWAIEERKVIYCNQKAAGGLQCPNGLSLKCLST